MSSGSDAALRLSPRGIRELFGWWTANAPRGQFWRFFTAWIFFTVGFSTFFFLFNIYLLGYGWTERPLGYIGSLTAVGGIVGTIPTGRLIERIGLRWTLIAGATLAVTFAALRACILWQPAQLLLALLGGMAMSTWGVCMSPTVAALAKEHQRPLVFSMMFSSGIGLAGVGGLISGNMTGWLIKSSWIQHLTTYPLSALQADRWTLLMGCAVAGLAILPLLHIKLSGSISLSSLAPQTRANNPFLRRFLPAMAVWGLVTGAFPPFANVYFVHHLGLSLGRTGAIFSVSQLVQFAAILSAPLLLRRTGLAPGIMITQLATAVSLVWLSLSHSIPIATYTYWTYMAAQYMNEPGIYSLLMERVPEHQRSRASAATHFVSSAAQAVAALAMGAAIVRFGYPRSVGVVAGLAAIAAILFRRLSRRAVQNSSHLAEPKTAT